MSSKGILVCTIINGVVGIAVSSAAAAAARHACSSAAVSEADDTERHFWRQQHRSLCNDTRLLSHVESFFVYATFLYRMHVL